MTTATPCVNADYAGDDDHAEQVATCDICHTTSCGPCRDAIAGSRSRCPQCNEILPSVGVKGSCGVGGCD